MFQNGQFQSNQFADANQKIPFTGGLAEASTPADSCACGIVSGRTISELVAPSDVTLKTRVLTATDRNGTINGGASSDDGGLTWSQIFPFNYSSRDYFQLASDGNGTIVALSSNGSTSSLSTDNGVTWVDGGTLPFIAAWFVAWGGGTFVAVGGVTDGTVCLTSPDGVTWTSQTLPTPVVGNRWEGIAYNASAGLFITHQSGGSATNQYATSSNGVSWGTGTFPTSQFKQPESSGAASNLFIICASEGTNICTSSDGSTWTDHATGVTPATYVLNSRVAWSGSVFCIMQNGNGVLTSPDGLTWTARTTGPTPSGAAYYGCVWTGSTFLSVDSQSANCATSPTGATWTVHSGVLPGNSNWNAPVAVALTIGPSAGLKKAGSLSESVTPSDSCSGKLVYGFLLSPPTVHPLNPIASGLVYSFLPEFGDVVTGSPTVVNGPNSSIIDDGWRKSVYVSTASNASLQGAIAQTPGGSGLYSLTGSFTIFVRTNYSALTTFGVLLGYSGSDFNNSLLGVRDTGKLALRVGAGAFSAVTASLSTGSHTYAFVCKGASGIDVYVDGSFVENIAGTVNAPGLVSGNYLGVGGFNAPTRDGQNVGYTETVSIFNRQLSASEIASLTTTPLQLYLFNESAVPADASDSTKVSPGGGNTYTRDQSESVTASDSSTSAASVQSSLSESESAAESSIDGLIIPVSEADAAAPSDSSDSTKTSPSGSVKTGDLSESVAPADAQTGALRLTASESDTATPSDSSTVGSRITAAYSETLGSLNTVSVINTTNSQANSTSATATVSVNASAGSLLVVLYSADDTANQVFSVSGVSGSTLGSFTISRNDLEAGNQLVTVVAWKFVTGALTGEVITVTHSGSGTAINKQVTVVEISGAAAAPIGATAFKDYNAGTGLAYAVPITPTAIGSLLLAAEASWFPPGGTSTANGTSTLLFQHDPGNSKVGTSWRGTGLTTSLSSVSIGSSTAMGAQGWQGSAVEILAGPASGPSDAQTDALIIPAQISESVAPADASNSTKLSGASSAQSETASPTDTQTAALALTGSETDSPAATDSSTAAITIPVSEGDSAVPADSSVSGVAGFAVQPESVSPSDSSTASLITRGALSETATTSDSSTELLVFANSQAEGPAPGDSQTASLALAVAQAEAPAATDASTIRLTLTASQADAATPSDASDSTRLSTGAADELESLTPADASTASVSAQTTFADAPTPSDSEVGGRLSSHLQSESVAPGDGQDARLVLGTSQSDSASASDAETAVLVLTASESDAVLVAESETDAYLATTSQAEITTPADAYSAAGVGASSYTDSVAASDSSTAAVITRGALSESASPADAETLLLTLTASEGDAAAPSDSSAGQATGTQSSYTDSASPSDACNATLIVGTQFTDSVAPADQSTTALVLRATESDSVQASDASAASNALNGALAEAPAPAPADAATALLTVGVQYSDAATAADSNASTQKTANSYADSVSPSDASDASKSGAGSVYSDSATPGDSSSASLILGTTASDSVAPSDAAAIQSQKVAATFVDAPAPADSSNATQKLTANEVDAAAPADSSNYTLSPRTGAESEAVAPADGQTVSMTKAGDLAESATPGDSSTAKVIFGGSLAEGPAASDGQDSQIKISFLIDPVQGSASASATLTVDSAEFQVYFNWRLGDDFNSGFG